MSDILVVEDEPILARNICDLLMHAGHQASMAANGADGLRIAVQTAPDLILLDYRLPDTNGLEILRTLRAQDSQAAIVLMTAHGSIKIAVEAMKLGASDFLVKPLDLKALKLVVERAVERRRIAASLRYFHERGSGPQDGLRFIAESPAMKPTMTFLDRLTRSKVLESHEPPSVLITGETGTGKDRLARIIHERGPRHHGEFVLVNSTAFPDELIESELFGHVRGAFTDARSDKVGLFEIASGGTLFLDEIGHLAPILQAKLLAVLEHRVIRPLGSTREKSVDVHVIAATNRDLAAAVRAGEFREDLYHRLRTLTVELPPLRERPEDVCALAEHYRERHALRCGKAIHSFSKEVRERFLAYDWPGNVRELAHVIESAVLMGDGPEILPQHISLAAAQPDPPDIRIGTQRTICLDFSGKCPSLDDIALEVIQAAVDKCSGNLSQASRLLGISRDAIRYRLQKRAAKSDET